tara:strand:+ start:605 stop:1459 length:855 start_codon:yes stop_codon:yes gene_type:complete
MSNTTEISVRGQVVFWTLSNKTDAEYLKNELELQNMGGFAPDKNTNKSSLKIALTAVCANRRRLVRSLVGERGYAVVSEHKDSTGVSLGHTVDFDALLPDGAGSPVFRRPDTGEIFNPPEENAILHRYQIEQQRCSSHKLGIAMVKMVDRLHGVSLRPTGGFYWIPEPAVPRWNALAKAIQDSSPDGSNVVYALKTAMDDELRRTVIDGLTHSLESEVGTMEEDVMSMELGKRALKTKKERCARLRQRVEGYRKMFSVALSDLDHHLDRVESAVSVCVLSQMGS